MKKKMATMICAAVMTISMTVPAFAGQWLQDAHGWWWRNDDGSWPANCWQWLDGNQDGVAECYYFNESGYCLQGTVTPDGYTVNADGAWTEGGVVQVRTGLPVSQNVSTGSKSVQDKKNIWSMKDVKSNMINRQNSAKDYDGNEYKNCWTAYATAVLGWDAYICYENEGYDYITVSFAPGEGMSDVAMGTFVVGDFDMDANHADRIEELLYSNGDGLQTLDVYVGGVDTVLVGVAHEYDDAKAVITEMYFHN